MSDTLMSSPSSPGPSECKHLTDALSIEITKVSVLKKYKAAVGWWAQHHSYALTGNGNGRQRKRRKIASPTCGTCRMALHRPFVCLHCNYGGCWQDNHIHGHLRDLRHKFCADIKTGSVFCSECEDFIYSRTMDDIYHAVLKSVVEKGARYVTSRNAKDAREPYKPWSPDTKEVAALETTSAIACTGRRGLLNLGQTCYLNVVLQSLLHNPLLRNYFLSDKHNSALCKVKDCVSCEMDKLFVEVYSQPTPTPHPPSSILSTTWRSIPELGGYHQQDAHEFFIKFLNQIHASSRGSTFASCNCVVHKVFAGQLMSEVRCGGNGSSGSGSGGGGGERNGGGCGSVVRTMDIFLDVSLELRPGPRGETTTMSSGTTLAGCLRRYTQAEKLSSEYKCGSCGVVSHAATKQLTIKKLPPILTFQFKRFEHKTRDKSSAKKIDTHIRFPATLNMAPFTTPSSFSSSSSSSSSSASASGRESPPTSTFPDALYEYDLFAVINHEGQIDNGHYTNFARSQDEWYRFDDDKVTHTTLEAVLESDAYMCFYAKRHLDYKPDTRPSYALTREVEKEVGGVNSNSKEREREAREREREAREKERERERELREREKERDVKEREQREREREVREKEREREQREREMKEKEEREARMKEKEEQELEEALLATV